MFAGEVPLFWYLDHLPILVEALKHSHYYDGVLRISRQLVATLGGCGHTGTFVPIEVPIQFHEESRGIPLCL